MSTVECEHSIGGNPRHPNTCIKCGREVSGRWLRDLRREASLVYRASKKPEYSASLIHFAQSRAGDKPVRSLRSRNMRREIEEELADAVNYLCWLDDQKAVKGLEGLNAGELAALHHVCEAWRWLHAGDDE